MAGVNKPIVIQRDVPIPPKSGFMGKKGHTKYSWFDQWHVGDCIDLENRKEADCIKNAIKRVKFPDNQNNPTVTTRCLELNGKKIIRMWRTA